MDEAVLGSLSSWWRSASAGHGPLPALADLCLALGRQVDRASARFLARQALTCAPDSIEALSLLESLTSHNERFELCLSYEEFLQRAPRHPQSERIRAQLIEILFAHGLVYSALPHVDAELGELAVAGPTSAQVAAACEALRAESDPHDSLAELEFELRFYQGTEFAAAAE